MATKPDVVNYEAEIGEVMRTTNLMRVEAAAIVARRYGETVDEIVGTGGPLTDEQRRRLGLGGSLADALIATPGQGDDGV
jgi:hypothetical protein